MFAYNKNYQDQPKQMKFNGFDKQSNSGDSDIGSKYKVFTLDYIFKKIIDYSED